MGDFYRSRQAKKGNLPDIETWSTVDLGPRGEGKLIVGRQEGSKKRLYLDLWTGVTPHVLVVGGTRGGKSSLMAAWSMIPMLQNVYHGTDWGQTLVLDPKRTGDYAVARSNGVRVIGDWQEIRDAIAALVKVASKRNEQMGQIEVERKDKFGVMRGYFATKIYDYDQEQRAEHGMEPILVVIEEVRDILGDDAVTSGQENRALRREITELFTQLAQKAGAAGIHLAAAVQQPRADILGGFARDQFGARILVGRAGPETVQMVMGMEARKVLSEADVARAGHGYAVNISDERIVQKVYVPLFDLDGYRSFAQRTKTPEPEPEVVDPGPIPSDLTGASNETIIRAAWLYLAEHGPATRSEIAAAINANPKTIRNLVSARRGFFVADGKKGREAVWKSSMTPPTNDSPRRGERVGGSGGSGGGGFIGDVQVVADPSWRDGAAVVVGPVVRSWLRVRALRHLSGPVLKGPFYRSIEVRNETWAKGEGRCACCGRTGQLEVDHDRTLIFGGEDDASNTRLLCERPGKASCHGAKTSAELAVLRARRRMGTAPGDKPDPAWKSAVAFFRLKPLWWWCLLVSFLLGLFDGRWWWIALGCTAVLGVLWMFAAASAARRQLAGRADEVVDPSKRRGPAIELHEVKGLKTWLAYITRRRHHMKTKVAADRLYVLRGSLLYLAGWQFFTLLGLAPAVGSLIIRTLI